MILLRNMILLLISFLFVTECQALDCLKHPSYCQIRKNNPRLSHIYALRLSNKIHKVCIKYKVPKRIYTAILAQESMYNVHAVAKMSGFDKNGNLVTVQTDFGMSQIHWKNVKRYNFDVQKLTNDIEYSLEAGAKILSGFKKRYGKQELWFLRYNCGAGDINRQTCKDYLRKVSRFL